MAITSISSRRRRAVQSVRDLFRAPVLGGAPQLVIRDIDSGISFSSDGKHFAFMRDNDPDVGKYQFRTANPDGSDEKMFAGRAGRGSIAYRRLADPMAIKSLRSNFGLGGSTQRDQALRDRIWPVQSDCLFQG